MRTLHYLVAAMAAFVPALASTAIVAEPPAATKSVGEPAEILAAVKQVAGQARFDERGCIEWLKIHHANESSDLAMPFLARLKSLKSLEVQDYRHGPTSMTENYVDPAWIESIAELTQLEELRGRRAGLNDTSLKRLAGLKKLRKLAIEFDDVTDAGLEALLALESLEELYIRKAEITNDGLKTLARMMGLKRLTLEQTRITPEGILALAGTSLEEFRWYDDRRRTREVLPYLKHLKHLRTIKMQSAVTDDDLVHIGEITTLETLNLARNLVTDAGLAHLNGLTRLRTLDLGGDAHNGKMRITDAGLAHLSGMTEIRYLDLRGSQITTAGLDLLKNLNNLETLVIDDTPLKKAKRIDLRHFTRLKLVEAYGFDIEQFLLPEGCYVEELY